MRREHAVVAVAVHTERGHERPRANAVGGGHPELGDITPAIGSDRRPSTKGGGNK